MPKHYLLEAPRAFADSLIWQLQRRYFVEQGIAAWRQAEVPQYLSSNPTIADAYAELVFAFWQDQQRRAPSADPLTICELGAGSGRFAFHFLYRLARLCTQAGLPLSNFRYVLTDIATKNLAYWQEHARFKPFFAQGVLDVALFDCASSDQLALQRSGVCLTAGGLAQPLVVIANYVFDSLPHELFYIADRRRYRCMVALSVAGDPATLAPGALLKQIDCRYTHEQHPAPPAADPLHEQILSAYQASAERGYLLFPSLALTCLARLKALAPRGLLLLTADKGDHRLAAVQEPQPPLIARHGSVSLNVNYHALASYCQLAGGVALFPEHASTALHTGCLLMVEHATDCTATQLAFQRHVYEFNSDDFYALVTHASQHTEDMTWRQLLAYLRLARYESSLFLALLPRLTQLARELHADQQAELIDTVERIWQRYFPLGEALDLAYQIGCLLYEAAAYVPALRFFTASNQVYGEHAGTLYNMALCHRELGQDAPATALLQRILAVHPDYQSALALLQG